MDLVLVVLLILLVTVFLTVTSIRRTGRQQRIQTQEKVSEPNQRIKEPQSRSRLTQNVITGKAHVIDGDTIVIRNTHIRLFGVDAPELHHPWGKKAKWEMVKLCKGQEITAELDGSSSHDRPVAVCRLPDGTDLSAELVRRGLAIDWPKFSGGRYASLEQPGVRKKLWRCHNRQSGKFVPD